MIIRYLPAWGLVICSLLGTVLPGISAGEFEVALPEGVKAVWDLGKAWRDTTASRERICLNGLWRWQPADSRTEAAPTNNWGFFKVPGCWPGITDYMQKDSQTVFAHPVWKGQKQSAIQAAWYERTITVPASWNGRRVVLALEYLNSFAAAWIDGRKAGEIHFPGGELDLSEICPPGQSCRLSLLVVAMPLKGVMLSYSDSASAREVKGSVARRGLCGDVFLVGTPREARLGDIRVETSVRKGELSFESALIGVDLNKRYALRARVMEGSLEKKKFTSHSFQGSALQNGRIALTEKWKPEKLWDLHTPQNTCQLEMSLLDDAGKVLDTAWPIRFGFREFWIEGRDFYLNGSRIFLSCVPLDNAQVSAGLSSYAAARESLLRLKSFGINFVYTHNYGCEPGSHLGFAGILRAADDVGMLVSFSQPHFSHYEWRAPDADQKNGYARHAEFYVRAAQNHPSVVFYSMSHNATGYHEDMNPDLIDGLREPRDTWALRNSKLALRAEAIVRNLDPSRIVYHHASGNLGSMYPINFYPNFVPIQELSDWFGHWAREGVKPVFLCEYGAPFTWDWTMYRGWYKGNREFGSAAVPWEFCIAEWNAQFFGDSAYRCSEPEKANLRWEAKQFRAGKLWHRWDYPNEVGSSRFEERYPVFEKYLTDNWRAFRTWGVSVNSPWEHGHFWKVRPGVNRARKEFKVDWENLQRPGFSPDYEEQRYERMDLAFERSDWIPTRAAEALLRNNRPLLAYIAGKPDYFTSKDHNFLPGEFVEKQLIIINNSRETVTAEYQWVVGLPQPVSRQNKIDVPTGQQQCIPIRFQLPGPTTPLVGRHEISIHVRFSNGEVQDDTFAINVLPIPTTVPVSAKIALFDPKGETARLLKELDVKCVPIQAHADLSSYDMLIVGKVALTTNGSAPDISRVRSGLKVLIFEQTSDVLQNRLGFRIAEYGLRQVFPRISLHPALFGLSRDNLGDWRGDATLLSPRLRYQTRPREGVTVQWCDLPVTRLWRCGNYGNVASVLIEKLGCGDFLPILDGGYSLQYSPLLEYHEGQGLVLFCQLDVTGRTEAEPAAARIARNLLRYVSDWKPTPKRKALYAGDPAGQKHFEAAGFSIAPYQGEPLSMDQVLVVAPGAQTLGGHAAPIGEWLKKGGHLLALSLDQDAANVFLPFKIGTKKTEHICTLLQPFGPDSLLAGICSADVHNRDPRQLPLITSGAKVIGNGILAEADGANVVFCQLAPWDFTPLTQSNLKRTFRRVSFLNSRLLANMGATSTTPLLDRFPKPVANASEKRFLAGLYLDQPEEWDDPYRFFRW